MKRIQFKPRTTFALAKVAVLMLAAGSCDGPRNTETTHPLPGRVPGAESATLISRDSVPSDIPPEDLSKWAAARDAIRDAHLVVEIGAEGIDQSDPTMFGRLADVAVDTAGFVYVLDEQAQEVRVFDFLGRFVHKFGGFGDGPSELRHAIGIELLADGRILVASRDHRVRVFAVSDDEWSADEMIEAPVAPRDVCSMPDGRVFINGYSRNTNTLVHQLPTSGTDSVTHAFGEGYQDENWLLQMELGRGPLACSSGERDLVVVGHHAIPVIRAFDSNNGSLAWASRLESFFGQPVYQGVDERGRNYIRNGRSTQWDVLGGMHPLAGGHLLVQVGHASMVGQTVTVESYLLDVESGVGAYLGDQVPRAIPFEGGYVALFEDPFPRLELRVFLDSPVRRTPSALRMGVQG